MHDLILLRVFIKKFKWFYFAACIGLFSACAYYYQKHTVYVSNITFLVNSSNLAEVLWTNSTEGQFEAPNDDRGYNRICQIIYSSRMIDYLIEKFDLYKHYGIGRNHPDSYLIVTKLLKSYMKVSISNTRIITVRVSDRLDYNVAANMANAIGKKVNDINRQITIESLTRKTEIFETLSKDLRSSSQREFEQMDSLLRKLEITLKTTVKDEGYKQILSMFIGNLENKSEKYFKDLFESYKYRLYSMYSLQEKNLPSISVLEKALPDKESKFQGSYKIYAALVVFSLMMPLFLAYLLVKSGPVFKYMMSQRVER